MATLGNIYTMDDYTFRHLTDWCDGFFREEEAEAMRNRIVDELEKMPAEEAEYSVSHGWRRVVDMLGL